MAQGKDAPQDFYTQPSYDWPDKVTMFTGVHISENTQAESLSKVLKKPPNGAPGSDWECQK